MRDHGVIMPEKRGPQTHGDMGDMAVAAHEEFIRGATLTIRRRLKDTGPQLFGENGEVLCVDCRDEIPANRLQAKPDATRCINCQEKLDSR